MKWLKEKEFGCQCGSQLPLSKGKGVQKIVARYGTDDY